jgi:alkylation response protein AidB-like acyl-CoA dehydrogenase
VRREVLSPAKEHVEEKLMHAHATPTKAHDATAAARGLSPLILRLRHETEDNRRIAAPIVDGLVDSRLCRMALTRSLHGLELPVTEALDVYETLARAEASVAWIAWNNALPCFLGRYLDNSAREEMFDDPGWLYASSTRPTGRASVDGDDYRIRGRWALVSGCELAEWIALLCIVEENSAPRMMAAGVPEMRFAFVRRHDCEIVDTWHASGLRGTGSHDVVVDDVRVPRRRTLTLDDPCTLDAPIGRVPIICTMAAGYAAQSLGVAQTALDTLVDLARTKVNADPGVKLGERPTVHAAIARHGAALAAARAHLHGRMAEVWDKACARATPGLDDIGEVWAAAHHAVATALSAVEAMHAAGGTSSLYRDCPLERAHRDMHAMSRHIIAQQFWLEDTGRVKLDIAPNHPLFAI